MCKLLLDKSFTLDINVSSIFNYTDKRKEYQHEKDKF